MLCGYFILRYIPALPTFLFPLTYYNCLCQTLKVSEELASEMIKEADVDNKGGLDFRAFVHVMTDGKGSEQALKPRRRMSLEEHEQNHKSMKLSMYIRRAWRGEVNKK